ncbi:hypothetical protein BCR44DRAFT_1433441 [Catenaria anguillulae PL171]|uniref:Uncharacterized protein n=1 Tax=Catenaria anguillulae PL171 TaxID=765915 RepID=A0A1Y2HMA7_9FUNG|nr:hypothetical protein BCR44DRAFT_1433441 [Catenaria anguillulae PL171]
MRPMARQWPHRQSGRRSREAAVGMMIRRMIRLRNEQGGRMHRGAGRQVWRRSMWARRAPRLGTAGWCWRQCSMTATACAWRSVRRVGRAS